MGYYKYLNIFNNMDFHGLITQYYYSHWVILITIENKTIILLCMAFLSLAALKVLLEI